MNFGEQMQTLNGKKLVLRRTLQLDSTNFGYWYQRAREDAHKALGIKTTWSVNISFTSEADFLEYAKVLHEEIISGGGIMDDQVRNLPPRLKGATVEYAQVGEPEYELDAAVSCVRCIRHLKCRASFNKMETVSVTVDGIGYTRQERVHHVGEWEEPEGLHELTTFRYDVIENYVLE